MTYWLYLNLGVVVALIGLGVIAIDKALEHSTVESKLSMVNTTVKMSDAVVATKGNTTVVGNVYTSASITVNIINPKGLNPEMKVTPTTISKEQLARHPELVAAIDQVTKGHAIAALWVSPYEAKIPVSQANAIMQDFSFKDVSQVLIKHDPSLKGVKTYISLVTVDNFQFYVIQLMLV